MSDKSKCTNDECQFSRNCYRHNAPIGMHQSYTKFTPTETGCEFFIEDTRPRFLFLDDIRNPKDAFPYTHQPIYISSSVIWDVVKNYNEFVEYVTKHNPKLISFDHDLADCHYAPMDAQENYEQWKAWQDAQEHKEKTGYDCAKWLIEHCMNNNFQCPDFLCHSMNPVGRDNIIQILTRFKHERTN